MNINGHRSGATNDDRRFGEQPLAQTTAAAASMRRLPSLLLSLEHAHPTVDSDARAVRRLGTRAGRRGAT